MKTEDEINTVFISEMDTSIGASTSRVKHILDAKYEKANLVEVSQKNKSLNKQQQRLLLKLLLKYEHLFDGKLGVWKDANYNIELKPDVSPYHARAYPIPRIHEQTLKKEIERLCKIGVLKKVNRSEWAAPTFIIPKKDGSV